jgi:hypothetical protein
MGWPRTLITWGLCGLIVPPLTAGSVDGAGPGRALVEPVWVLDPASPGPDLPPAGRSVFDYLIGDGPVPFPFEALLTRIESELAPGGYLGHPLKRVLIPLGRSLQRESAAPDFFHYPRVVVAVDGEPAERPGHGGLLLRDRLYLGYLEKADVVEVISYNETAGRFEYQLVRDYRADGERRVSYAPRTLCGACHQNGAPLFARPLWDETNANAAVRERLAAQGRDFYGLNLDPGIDEAYAIDNATDRANGYSLTQLLWSEGCGEGAAGAACRAALLLRAIQWRLSGGRGFDDGSQGYRRDLEVRLAATRDRLWPQGLKIPNPDIPNRRPLETGRPLPDGQPLERAAALFAGSDIPAAFEPLAPRDPLELWRPDDKELAARAVSGLADFLTGPDLRRLDDRLASRPASETRVLLTCELQRGADTPNGETWRLGCGDDDVQLRARLHLSPAGAVTGRISALDLEGQSFGELRVTGSMDGGELELTPYRLGQRTRLRLGDGRRLASMQIRPNGIDRALLRLTLVDDVEAIAEVLEDLTQRDDEALSPAPLRRSVTLAALFDGLGLTDLAWCCAADDPVPPLRGPGAGGDSPHPGLGPFYQVCARCHQSPESFPPNFLTGPPELVAVKVSGCAERIAYRLGMWTLDPGARTKTPMPPHFVLASLGVAPPDWPTHPTLVSLQQSLGRLAAGLGRPLPPLGDLLKRDYAALTPCLPEQTPDPQAPAAP